MIGRIFLGVGFLLLPGALSAPCTTTLSIQLTVESSQDASLAAQTVNCDGGSFIIQWVGNIVVPTVFNVSGGTVLSVYGGGSTQDDIMDGGLANQLFTVSNNGKLNLEGLTITGASHDHDGGMLYAADSVVTMTNCVIAGNAAGEDGGAVYLRDSHLEVYGVTTFERNVAGDDGGETLLFCRESKAERTKCLFQQE